MFKAVLTARPFLCVCMFMYVSFPLLAVHKGVTAASKRAGVLQDGMRLSYCPLNLGYIVMRVVHVITAQQCHLSALSVLPALNISVNITCCGILVATVCL